MGILLAISIGAYLVLIIVLCIGFYKLPKFEQTSISPKTRFSILIPFRNEEIHLPSLLHSIRALEYPISLFEILLINDSSVDDSVAIIKAFVQSNSDFDIKVISNNRQSHSPKKDAIQTAIHQSHYEWIITTDADCEVPPLWLKSIDAFIQKKKPKLIAGPVMLKKKKHSFLTVYEIMDTLSLQGATMGGFGVNSPFLCNGANLIYEKNAFSHVKGYEGNNHIASGDDHFLLEKFIKTYPKDIQYLKSQEAIITTTAQKNWQTFLSQRKRWASKAIGYTNPFTKVVGIIVLIANLVLSLFFVYAFAKALFPINISHSTSFYIILWYLTILLKLSIDGILIFKTAIFFKIKQHFFWYLLASLSYPFISSYIALSSLKGGFTWKGRSFKR